MRLTHLLLGLSPPAQILPAAAPNFADRPVWEVPVISSFPSVPSPAQHICARRGDSARLSARFNAVEIAATAVR